MSGFGGWPRIAIGAGGAVRLSSARDFPAAAAAVESIGDTTGTGRGHGDTT
jgi:hypothetical protein